MTIKSWECLTCSLISDTEELLRAPSPFDPEDVLVGCPGCKSTEGFTGLCEIEACNRAASCGGPGADGVYRQTCGEHADWLRKDHPTPTKGQP